MAREIARLQLLTLSVLLFTTLQGLLSTYGQSTPRKPVQGYVDAWSSVLALHPRAPIVIVTGRLHRCEFASADEASVTCVRRFRAPYGDVAMPITLDRRLVQEIALDMTPARATPREDEIGAGALGGGTLGLLVGDRIGKSGENAARGAVAGAVVGALVAAFATRHHERLTTIYRAP